MYYQKIKQGSPNQELVLQIARARESVSFQEVMEVSGLNRIQTKRALNSLIAKGDLTILENGRYASSS